ncbi:MAG: hypothetical protein H6R44_215 [Nitrospirae bacterium]|nr:hypothetical protein [Nitrospirota bacterium]
MAKVPETDLDRNGRSMLGSRAPNDIYHQRQREITKMMTKTSARFI